MRKKSKRLILILGLIVFLITWAAFFRWVNPQIKQQFLAGQNITHEADLSELGASISLNTTSIAINVGGTYTLVETGHQECVFSTMDSSIAKCNSTSSYATITGMSVGTTTIRVMLKNNYAVYKDVPVIVTESTSSDFSLSCAETELSVGEEMGIKADNEAQEYTWTTSNSSVATISNNPYIAGSHTKLITAHSPGTAVITASSGTKSKSVVITVTGSSTVVGGDFNVWTSVDGIAEINQSLTNNMFFSVKPEPTSGTSYGYTVEINPSTSYTSLSGYQWQLNGMLPIGTTTIKITDLSSGKSASKSITVLAPKTYTITYHANGGTGAPASQTKTEGTSLTLSSTKPTRDGYEFLGWSTNSSATSATYSSGETYTSDGNATLYAVWRATTVSVTGVSLDKSSINLTEGSSEKLTTTILPSNATNKDVTWKSSNESVATVTGGTVTGKKVGTATITATTVDGAKTATCTVTVTAKTIPVTSIGIETTAETTIEIGKTLSLNAVIQPSNATNKNVKWSSSNEAIASVNSSGIVTAKGAGTTTITVTSEDGGKTANCNVTVKAKVISVTEVSLDKKEVNIEVDKSIKLTPTISPDNATNKDVTWKSSDETIAMVTGGTVTGKKAGTTTITATTVDGAKTATCQVTVTSKAEESIAVIGIAIDKTNTTIEVGEKETLTATIQPANATNKNVTWKSSDETVVTVSNGVITGKKVGMATITVTTVDGTKVASCKVTVEKKTTSEDKTPPVINKVEQSGDICYVTASDMDSGIEKVVVNDKDITSQKTSDGRYWFKLEKAGQYVIQITDKAGNTVIKQFNYKLGSSDGTTSDNTDNNTNSTSNTNNSNSNYINNSSNKNTNSNTTTDYSNRNILNSSNNLANRIQQANTTDANIANKILPKTGLEKGIGIAIITISGFAIYSVIKYKKLK